MSSTPPSHRSPLTLLSKLKRQLSKSPVTHQPIEHQYLPIPTVSFSESLHSHSTYSCSNKSSSASSFIFIDHNEEPPSVAEDEYRPFLPLIIQHERLQQRLSAVTTRAPPPLPPPPIVPARTQRARRTLPLNEPPSPTSTASSPSPVTPIFTSTFFRTDDEDEDGIMTLSNSEVGSISEYPLPRSLSAYMQEPRSIRSRKSSSAPNSDSESRRGRLRGIHGTSIRVSFVFFYSIFVPLPILFFFFWSRLLPLHVRALYIIIPQGDSFLRQFPHLLHALCLIFLYLSNLDWLPIPTLM